ncbi:GyrI-like domain-containing protein [Lysinibacillus cavernae]|uniref:GyrI-like domain-containing protein n=1 Tax=Lysinibacillus cavernae TaxID=2666135 RepID=UPI0012D9F293|nr:effector binding domain-containing protein [Lysinibacillus cavernae]
MLLKDIEMISRQEMKLIGYSTKASLNEDIQLNIVKNLREQVLNEFPQITNRINDSIYLIQVYDDEEWTPDTPYTHIIAVEVTDFSFVPNNMITHTIPNGKFLLFKHQGPEEGIDSTYVSINDWLEENNYVTPRSFDMEQWGDLTAMNNSDNLIKIYIPL